jgi:hypothetical protein
MTKLTKFQSQRINRIRQEVLNSTVVMGWRKLNPDDGGTSQFTFPIALNSLVIRQCIDSMYDDEVTDQINKYGATMYADELTTAFNGATLNEKTEQWMRLISHNPRKWRVTVAVQSVIPLTGERYVTCQVIDTGNAKHADIVEAVGEQFAKLRSEINSQHPQELLLWFAHPVVKGKPTPDYEQMIKEAMEIKL